MPKKNEDDLGKTPKKCKPYCIELTLPVKEHIEQLFSQINNEKVSDYVTAGIYLLHKQLVEDIPNSQSGESQNQTDE
jgi:membrane-bound lytic murein transglycosylase MltF